MEHEERVGPYLVFILALSIVALVALAVEVAVPLDEGSRRILWYADFVICGLFLVDFFVTLRNAKNKKRYLLTWGWLDLVSSIPAVGFLRLARAARVLRILRILRTARSARMLSTAILRRRAQSGALAAALASVLLVVSASIAILQVERAPESNIKGAGDAVWWSMETITTIGYGDRFPVTPEGRLVGAVLMVAGVGLFGTFSGLVASWLLKPSERSQESELASMRRELAEIKRCLQGMGGGCIEPGADGAAGPQGGATTEDG